MTKISKKIIWSAIAVLFYLPLAAQQEEEHTRTIIASQPEYAGCFYRNYPATEARDFSQERPEGYQPFYISHYGRHGSRWVSDRIIYDRTKILMEKAARQQVLTPEGKELLEEVRTLFEEAEGRAGELSPRGGREHRGIAERMYRNWPEVFRQKDGKPVRIDSRATVYTRCIYSMINFDERLKELAPELQISRKASKKDLHYMADYSHTGESYKLALGVSDSLARAWIRPERFLGALFNDADFIARIEEPQVAMLDFFHLAADLQAIDRQEMDLFRHFTREEIFTLWKVLDTQTFIEEGPSRRFGKDNRANAINLLENIVRTADEVIAGERDEAATLRFGHESNIVPLFCLMGIGSTDFQEGISKEIAAGGKELDLAARWWNISEICPMATNLQFIFFRNDEGRIKVRVLHNEKDAQLPVEGAPFYDWTVLKTYLEGRIRN